MHPVVPLSQNSPWAPSFVPRSLRKPFSSYGPEKHLRAEVVRRSKVDKREKNIDHTAPSRNEKVLILFSAIFFENQE